MLALPPGGRSPGGGTWPPSLEALLPLPRPNPCSAAPLRPFVDFVVDAENVSSQASSSHPPVLFPGPPEVSPPPLPSPPAVSFGVTQGGALPPSLSPPTLFDCPIAIHPSASLSLFEEQSPLRRSLRLDVKCKGQLKPSLLRAQDLLGQKHKVARFVVKVARPSSVSSARPLPHSSGAGQGSSTVCGLAGSEESPGVRNILAPLSSLEILAIQTACGVGGGGGG